VHPNSEENQVHEIHEAVVHDLDHTESIHFIKKIFPEMKETKSGLAARLENTVLEIRFGRNICCNFQPGASLDKKVQIENLSLGI